MPTSRQARSNIRVKTYAYKLQRIQEELEIQSEARVELAKRIAKKRGELEIKYS